MTSNPQLQRAASAPGLWRDPLQLTALLIVGTLAALRHLAPTAENPDISISLLSAIRLVSEGEIPYRDANLLYGPLGHYVLGMLLEVVPAEPRTAAIIFFFLNALVNSVLIAVLLRPASPAGRAERATSAYLSLAVGSYAAFHAFYSAFALTLVLLATLVARVALHPEPLVGYRRFAPVLLAAIGAATVFTRNNFGGYVVIAAGFAFVVAASHRIPGMARRLAAYLGGGIALLVLSIATMAIAGFAREFVADFISYVQRIPSRELPIPEPSEPSFVLTVLSAGGIMVAGIATWRTVSTYAVYLVALALLFFTYSMSRFDGYHNYPFVVVSVITAITLYRETSVKGLDHPRWRLARITAFAPLVCTGLLASVVLVNGARPWLSFAFKPASRGGGWPHYRDGEVRWRNRVVRKGFLVTPGEVALLDYLAKVPGSASAVFHASFPGSCECTTDPCVNVGLYLIQGKVPQGKYWFFDTPTTPYVEVQERIVADLAKRRDPLVVLHQRRGRRRCPATVMQREATVLRDFVESRYIRETSIDVQGSPVVFHVYRLRDDSLEKGLEARAR